MKIKKLKLHNIASFTDAEIDFDKAPLANTDLFLLTGNTGSGKTTILDAVCLALYNQSPRLKNEGKTVTVNKDTMKSDDPRHLMRANTGEAYVVLTFDGNDKKEYKVTWSVQRGLKKKVGQQLNNQVWTVENETDNIIVSGDNRTKYPDVQAVIKDAVGLDFDQFCRTTMLPQGQFTQFLKSGSTEKGKILEKISGTEIYSRIGKTIWDLSKKATDEYKLEEAKHAQIEVMEPAVRQQKEDELKAKQAEESDVRNLVDNLNARIVWIVENMKRKQTLAAATANLDGYVAKMEDPGFKSLCLDIEQWLQTVDVRKQIDELAAAEAALEGAQRRRFALEQYWRSDVAGHEFEMNRLLELQKELKSVEAFLCAQQVNAKVYANVQTILAKMDSVVKGQEKLLQIEKNLSEQKDSLPQMNKRVEECLAEHAAAQGALMQARKKFNEIEQSLAAVGLPELRKEKEFLASVKVLKESVSQIQNDMNAEAEVVNKLKADLPVLEADYAREVDELKALECKNELRKETIDGAVRTLRAKLKVVLDTEEGICPVCRQKVAELPADEIFDEAYRVFKKELDQKAESVKIASDKLNKYKAQLSVEKKAYEGLSMNLSQKQTELAAKLTGRQDIDEMTAVTLEQIDLMVEELSGKISQGEDLEKERTAASKVVSDAVVAEARASNRLTENKAQVEGVVKSIAAAETDRDSMVEEIKLTKSDIAGLLDGSSGWENEWMDPEKSSAFCAELTAKAERYNESCAEKTRLDSQIQSLKSMLDDVQVLRSDVQKVMSEWNTDGVSPVHVPDLKKKWSDLMADVKVCAKSIESESQKVAECEKKIDEFFAANPSFNYEVLEYLSEITPEQYKEDVERRDKVLMGSSTAKGVQAAAQKACEDHLAERPQGDCDENKLQEYQDDLQDKKLVLDMLHKCIGDIEKELDKDDDAQKKKGNTTLLDQLRIKMEKWKRLNSLLGDAEGKTLQQIAQGCILDSLLSAANVHLHNMAPRYRLLRVTNGEPLDLMLEDSYNGFSTRVTNAISGGESFLVSLALALALADFGQHMGVETLFIDEGFGTLSGEPLQNAISTLKSLHSKSRRRVGIISHREEVRENIPVQIEVKQPYEGAASEVGVQTVI